MGSNGLAKRLKRLPVKIDPMSGPIRCDSHPIFNPEGMGNEAFNTKPMYLQAGGVGHRSQQVYMQVVHPMGGNWKVVRLCHMGYL
jgi:hypothetical protein